MTNTEFFLRICAPAIPVSLSLTAYGCNLVMQGTNSKIRTLSKIIGIYMLLNQAVSALAFYSEKANNPSKNQYNKKPLFDKIKDIAITSFVIVPGLIRMHFFGEK